MPSLTPPRHTPTLRNPAGRNRREADTPDRDVYVTIGRIVVEIKMTAVCAEATSLNRREADPADLAVEVSIGRIVGLWG